MGEFNSQNEEKDKDKNENDKKFNLLDKEWINVVTNYKGTTERVGMRKFFEHAHEYIALAGDTPTQDFAVMRFLLAVLHTVFSRYDADGKAYEILEMNDRMQPIEEPEEYLEEYEDLLMDTWKDLWNKGKFPEIVNDYLEKWRDRFDLFDDKYPFYQVTKDILDNFKCYSNQGDTTKIGDISFKTINRKISETRKNYAIFSMIDDYYDKEKLSNEDLSRWLIHYMGYSSTPDKTKIRDYLDLKNIKKYDGHKGWQYSIGAIHYKADNLFKTLLLNLVLVHPNEKFAGKMQTPAWELSPEENVRFYLENNSIDNLARLYTDYSRCVYIPKEENETIGFFNIVQLPALDKKDNFLECMTIWEYVKKKDDAKKTWYSKENNVNEAMWRNFGLIYLNNQTNNPDYRAPDIINWFIKVSDNIKNKKFIKLSSLGIKGVMASNVMSNEMNDDIYIDFDVSRDISQNGWIVRINEIIEHTKAFINETYRGFAEHVIRLGKGISSPEKEMVDSLLENVYFALNNPFKDWLASIVYKEDKEKKIKECKEIIKEVILNEARKTTQELGPRAYIGIKYKNKKDMKYTNIAIAFNQLVLDINKF